MWGPAWLEIHWNSIWLRAWSHMTSHYTWGFVTTCTIWFWGCVGTAFGRFLLGSHDFVVTVLGSCVKGPSTIESVEVGTYHLHAGSKIRSPIVWITSTTWMPTWRHFSEVGGLGLVLEVGLGKKIRPDSQHKSCGFFWHEIANFHDI